jgi:hypothetical protein
MGLHGRAVRFGPWRSGARREVKRSGAEQSDGSAGKAELTAGPGCSEMSGARAGVWSGPVACGLGREERVREWAAALGQRGSGLSGWRAARGGEGKKDGPRRGLAGPV